MTWVLVTPGRVWRLTDASEWTSDGWFVRWESPDGKTGEWVAEDGWCGSRVGTSWSTADEAMRWVDASGDDVRSAAQAEAAALDDEAKRAALVGAVAKLAPEERDALYADVALSAVAVDVAPAKALR